MSGKRLGYIILHYGSPYLSAALEAIAPQVDKIIILYANSPSQGHGTKIPCPDSRNLLRYIAAKYMQVYWVDGNWTNEGDHTNAVFQYADGYEWLIRFDADEIYPPDMINTMICQAELTDCGLFQFPFIHFWKSFNQVCRDSQAPYRMIRMNRSNESKILDSENGNFFVHHMGYAIPNEFMRYKWEVQAHKPELRPEWFKDKWLSSAIEDVHPVSRGMWNVEHFDKAQLPGVLKRHPYYHIERIM